MKRIIPDLVAVLSLVLGVVPLVRAGPFTFRTIDFPGAVFTDAIGINDAGQIVGDYDKSSSHVVGDGRKVNVTDLRWALKEGPGNMLCMNARGVCVTHVMEDLRRLKGEYPAGLPLRSPSSFKVSSRGASSST